MTQFLSAVLTLAFIYILICLIKPLPPFSSRKQAFVRGFLSLLGGMVFTGIVAAGVLSITALEAKAQKKPQAGPPSLPVRAIIQMREGGGQIIFRRPKVVRLSKGDVAKGVWSLKQEHLDIICFADGNNALMVHVGDEYYAANGKARQFVDYDKNEGLVSTNNRLIQLHTWPGGMEHLALHTSVIEAGFKLCPRKSLDSVIAATRVGMASTALDIPKAQSPSKAPTIIVVKKPKLAPFTKAQNAAARILVEAQYGSAYCNDRVNGDVFDEVADKHKITRDHWVAHEERLMALAVKKLGPYDKINCKAFYRKYGPRGLKLLFKSRGK